MKSPMPESLATPERRPRRTQQERSDTMCARLLDATVATLVERGYVGTSTVEVCRRAGASRGAQLHHYPTKAALVGAAVERLFESRLAELRASFGPGAAIDDLDALFSHLWSVYRGPTLYAWLELVVAARTDPELRSQIEGLHERFFDTAQQAFRELAGTRVPAEVIAPATRMVLSLLDGLALNHVIDDDHDHAEAVLAAFKALLSPWVGGARRK
jgi:AcrR family transcriptional regulator